MMRCVISGNHIYRSIAQAFKNRVDVIRTAQRRAHFGVRVIVVDGFVSERPVMRRNFTGHRQAFFLGASHRVDRAACGNVRQVQARAGQFRE